jgi:hypothetical protein
MPKCPQFLAGRKDYHHYIQKSILQCCFSATSVVQVYKVDIQAIGSETSNPMMHIEGGTERVDVLKQ